MFSCILLAGGKYVRKIRGAGEGKLANIKDTILAIIEHDRDTKLTLSLVKLKNEVGLCV